MSAARRGRAAGALALALLPTALGACTSWRPVRGTTAGGAPAVSERRPVRITRADGTRVTLRQAAVTGDSLVGYADGDPPQRTAIALRDVARVDERRVDADRTGLAVIGGVAGLGLAALVGLFILIAAINPS